ncbi:hypothetical protein JXA80_11580 [bacterium]|nr:hypothetical protein [candidate division CSSED10-310 bacterium]
MVVIGAGLMYLLVQIRRGHRDKQLFRRRSRAVITGLVSEQLAPLIHGFPGSPADARFLGKPVDYIVFDGLSEGYIRNIVFVEVKSRLRGTFTDNERLVRDAVNHSRIRWEVFTLDQSQRKTD